MSKRTKTKPDTQTDPMNWIHAHTDPRAFNVEPQIAKNMLFDIWQILPNGELQRFYAAEDWVNLPQILRDLGENAFCFATVHVTQDHDAQTMKECMAAFAKSGGAR